MVNWNAAAIALFAIFCLSGDNKTIIMEITKEHWKFQCMLNVTESNLGTSVSIKIGIVYIHLNAGIEIDALRLAQFSRLNAHVYFEQFDIMLPLFG